MDLSTRYMGLQLRNPLVASASPLSRTLDGGDRLRQRLLRNLDADRRVARHGAKDAAQVESAFAGQQALRSRLVQEAFGLSLWQALQAAYLVGRAEIAAAPFPDNDVPKAEAYMRRFYALVTVAAQNGVDDTAANHGLATGEDPAMTIRLQIGRRHENHVGM